MAFTFNASLATSRDRLRLAIGDTDANIPEFQDETLDVLLAENSFYQCILTCFDFLIAKYSRYASERVGSVSVDYGALVDNFIKMKAQAKKQYSVSSAVPYAGGISSSDKALNNADSDVVKPVFTKTLHNNIGTAEEDDEA